MTHGWTPAGTRPACLAGLVVVLLAAAVVAEEPAIAELEVRLESATGATRLELLNELAYRVSFRSVATGRGYAEEALALARELGNRSGEGQALRNLAVADSVAGDHRASIAHAEQALAIFDELGDKGLAAASLNIIGVGHRMLSEYDQALAFYERCLALDREIGNRAGVARALGNVGNVHYDRGDYGRALEVHQEALVIERELDDSSQIMTSLNNIGIALYRLGDYQGALENLLEALRLHEAAGELSGVAGAAVNIGNIFEHIGQLDRAAEYFQRALDAHTEVGTLDGMAGAHLNLGNICQLGERLAEAEAHYLKALELARRVGSPRLEASALDSLGHVERHRGAPERALPLHRQALALRESLGVLQDVALSNQNLGLALHDLGRLDEARPPLERALALARECGAATVVQEVLSDLSGLHAARGEFETALGYAQQAAAARETYLNERSNDRVAELETRYQMEARKRENELLAKENEIRRLEASRARLRANLMLVALAVVLTAVVLLLRRYRDLLRFWKRKSLVGHYRIVDTIAEGGMGVVYRAESLVERSGSFALKLIRDEHAADPAVRRRFLHEAAVVDQLDHPHIVRVHERGEDSGRLYIAMELLEGPSLAELIRRGQRLALPAALHVMRQLAAVVAAIHAKGVLHRDLKPANVILVEREGDPSFVKLLDFGLARSQSLTRLTETGAILGTIAYLPPEQITEQRFTAASDVYALGVVFYELLTLCPAFPGGTPVEVIQQILRGEVVPPTRLRPDLPVELERLLLEMMATDPAARPGDGEVVDRLGEMDSLAVEGEGGGSVVAHATGNQTRPTVCIRTGAGRRDRGEGAE